MWEEWLPKMPLEGIPSMKSSNTSTHVSAECLISGGVRFYDSSRDAFCVWARQVLFCKARARVPSFAQL